MLSFFPRISSILYCKARLLLAARASCFLSPRYPDAPEAARRGEMGEIRSQCKWGVSGRGAVGSWLMLTGCVFFRLGPQIWRRSSFGFPVKLQKWGGVLSEDDGFPLKPRTWGYQLQKKTAPLADMADMSHVGLTLLDSGSISICLRTFAIFTCWF